jgi:hypothetical protein
MRSCYPYGNLPKHINGPNKGAVDHKAAASRYGFTLTEIKKANNNWIAIFRIKGSNLSFEQYLDKLLEAKINPSQVGIGSGKYHLARLNDEGPYTENSCRFITSTANSKEQKHKIAYTKYICLNCSIEFTRPKRFKPRKFCSRSCASHSFGRSRPLNKQLEAYVVEGYTQET